MLFETFSLFYFYFSPERFLEELALLNILYALMCVLPFGMARGHRGNPAAVLRVEALYGLPVLLSGLSSLVLNCTEIDMLKKFHKESLQKLQKLHRATPESVVYFLGGSLPLPALLDIRCLSLLNMIAQLGPNHIMAKKIWKFFEKQQFFVNLQIC